MGVFHGQSISRIFIKFILILQLNIHKFQQLELQKEEIKINDKIPLCISLKQFGHCSSMNCPNRHILDSELDYNKFLPQNGIIKYKILKMIDVNHLRVSIIEHKDLEGNISDYKNQQDLIDEKLTSILNQNKTKAVEIKEGSSYAFWDEIDFNDMFRECIIQNIKNNVVDIIVKNSGKRTSVSKSKIFELPDEFNRNNIEGKFLNHHQT